MRRGVLALVFTFVALRAPAGNLDEMSVVLLALVDITMADGAVVEYVAPISRPITLDDVTTDGFYVIRTRPNGQEVSLPYLFNKEFVWLEPGTARRQFVSRGPVGELPGLYGYRTYYLHDVTARGTPPFSESEQVVEEADRRILAREKVFSSRHEMLDYAPVYDGVLAALQGECHPGTGKEAPEPSHVPLTDIVRFTLIHERSAARLDAIRAAVGYWRASVTADDPDASGHTWYHDVVADERRAEWRFRAWRMTP